MRLSNLRDRQGRVVLVGAGPGDPDLLTLRAARELQQADVVLYDQLVGAGILELCRVDARLIDVGKLPHGKSTSQDVINALLAREAADGYRVVRLKGGDPFVFGRGGEEMQYLVERGIDVQVVPGVSSAIAGPAAAGIPVTHRGVSTHFSVVTGFSAKEDPETLRRTWHHLGAAGGTLIVLMGLSRLDDLVATLLAAGVETDRPAAAIYAATTDQQQVLEGTLATLPSMVAEAGLRNHTLLVIGDVVALRSTLTADWLQQLAV